MPELAHKPRQDTAGETHERAHHEFLAEEVAEVAEIHPAGGETANDDGRRLRPDVAAHGADDQHERHQGIHVGEGDLKPPNQHRRHRETGQRREQPRQSDAGDSEELIGIDELGLTCRRSGHVHDVLVRLFLKNIDHIVVDDPAEEPPIAVDHRQRHEIVPLEDPGNALLVFFGGDRVDLGLHQLADRPIASGDQQRPEVEHPDKPVVGIDNIDEEDLAHVFPTRTDGIDNLVNRRSLVNGDELHLHKPAGAVFRVGEEGFDLASILARQRLDDAARHTLR